MIERADAALLGDVVEVDEPLFSGGHPTVATVTIRVTHDLKDNLPPMVTLDHETQSSACGVSFEEGEQVGMTLYDGNGGWSTSSCSQLSPEKVLALRGPEVSPEPDVVPLEAASGAGEDWILPLLVSFAGGVALVVGGVLIWRRVRRRRQAGASV